MRKLIQVLAASTALTAALPAFAQEAQSEDSVENNDIIVTARRSDEKLQDVPVSIQAISGERIEKLAITQAADLGKLAPGLNIGSGGGASTSAIVLRGIRWSDQSGTPAIPLYLNEVSFGPTQILATLYDIGQVEVLRGPQGTSRGAPSIPGAVTFTTRKASLDEIGGFVQARRSSFGQTSLQAAVGGPLINGKLGIRLAASLEDGKGNRVQSINNAEKPLRRTISTRLSLRWEPSDTVQINAMWQHNYNKTRQYSGVYGPGSPGGVFTNLFTGAQAPNPFMPANYNGPAIGLYDRLAVQRVPARTDTKTDLLTLNASAEVFNHKLTYIAGFATTKNSPDLPGSDPANQLQGIFTEGGNITVGRPKTFAQELRLSSLRTGDSFIDYDIGAYYYKTKSQFAFTSYSYLPGSFGSFFAPANPVVTNPAVAERYTLPARINVDLQSKNYSFYGNVELHLPADIELTGGVRWQHDERPFLTTGPIGPAFLSLPAFAFGAANCGQLAPLGAVNSTIYPGQCDIPYSAAIGPTNIASSYTESFTPVIYNVSLSRKFGQNVLLYANVGSSYRIGVPNTGVPVTDPTLERSREEYATSYEVGVKTNWLDGRLTLNATAYLIDYKNQITQINDLHIFSVTGNKADRTSNFFSNINTRVQGIEVEATFRPTSNFTLSGSLSYSKIKSAGGSTVPCNKPGDGFTAGEALIPGNVLSLTRQANLCPAEKGLTVNPTAPFQANLNGDFNLPLSDNLDGYFRFLVNYQGNNPQFGTGNFPVKGYAIVDLFAGLAGEKGKWDLGAFVRNVFDNRVLLNSSALRPIDSSFGSAGYSSANITLPREFGVSLRYAFGSR